MSRVIVPYTDEELAGLTFSVEGTEDWAFMFMRAMATIEQQAELIESMTEEIGWTRNTLYDLMVRLNQGQKRKVEASAIRTSILAILSYLPKVPRAIA
jgi:hypothetical protein